MKTLERGLSHEPKKKKNILTRVALAAILALPLASCTAIAANYSCSQENQKAYKDSATKETQVANETVGTIIVSINNFFGDTSLAIAWKNLAEEQAEGGNLTLAGYFLTSAKLDAESSVGDIKLVASEKDLQQRAIAAANSNLTIIQNCK